ncbi:LOW QUALITY PROTEIN: glucosidase 2 subunit beta-like [Boleophthalmus pectinirostris]|uniref:LOW QUALITY PROTEIN: glucosidase 2 subunit beta-like n=1 Tax=Boleophthalmus pectinirostris TaxID=150288 RepID=UPI0024328080|nr:LOW QUALITY PROTEIN: glucosidase 2 subunit beta-like [Boleophthalmus pectinirostris]
MTSKVMTENWHNFLRFIFNMRFHIVVAAVVWSDLVDSRKIRGISSSYKRFYKEKKSFLCIDGSKMIPFEQVNDDYCDCQDGSDEPGTSACPRGRFYCTNLGFRPHYIPSSRVNDGICDCCDASDEYNSPARCQNSCWNLGQRERAFVEGQMRALDEGLRLKQQLIEEGVLLWREKQAQLRDLQQVAEDLQIKLEEHRRKKNEAEQTLKALQSSDGHTRYNSSAVGLFNLLDSNKDGSLSVEEIQSKVTFIQDEQRVLTEDEAVTLLGGGRRMDLSTFGNTLWDTLTRGDSVKIKDAHAAGAGRSVGEDPHLKAADRAAEWEATNLKKAEESYEQVNAEISELQRKLAIDYGTDWEFLFLNSQCFQLQVYEYTYTLCPFNQATQRSAAGTEVSLGVWGMWSGNAQNPYSQQLYENGEPCWQGGSRSTTVTLTCGTETGLRTAKEPSKCQYIMDLQTPVACQPVLKQRGVHSEL